MWNKNLILFCLFSVFLFISCTVSGVCPHHWASRWSRRHRSARPLCAGNRNCGRRRVCSCGHTGLVGERWGTALSRPPASQRYTSPVPPARPCAAGHGKPGWHPAAYTPLQPRGSSACSARAEGNTGRQHLQSLHYCLNLNHNFNCSADYCKTLGEINNIIFF